MPTREQALSAYETLEDYKAVGARLGVPAGQAYLIATGLPADGGDTYPSAEHHRPGTLDTSTQALLYHDLQPESPTTKSHVHGWIARKARADVQMRAAAAARDAAPGEVEEPEETDICTVLTRDHDQVVALMKQLKTVPGVSDGGTPVHQSRRKSIVDMVTIALSRHEASEQEHFWPAVREAFDDGEEAARKALAQEQEGKDLLHRLGELDASDEEFDELVVELDKASRKHVAFEDVVLLAIRRDWSMDDRRALGAKLRRAESHAPTRPHPHAPKSPATAVKAAGAAAAAMDMVRDTVGSRPAERKGKATREAKAETQARARARQDRQE